MAFYLTYRPQKIADLDLPEIREGLLNVLTKKNPPHAFLFSGPRGSGKTSAARIVAKSLNCEKGEKPGEPCGKCDVCQAVAKGSLLDLIEIDGASNRGVDDVRSLKENIKLVPSKGKVKVYIIDEVHMLTTEAFNALLKTLEEPPVHAFFILCTTEPEKLPETIISRCLQFNFRKAKPVEVEASLQKVIKGEKIKIDQEAVKLLAKSVDGSFRDAQKVLDQLSGLPKIGVEEIQKTLGQGAGFGGREMVLSLAQGPVGMVLSQLERLADEGVDFRQFSRSVLEALRDLLMVRVGVGDFKESQPTQALSLLEIKHLLRLFSLAAREVKGSLIEQLPLEIAVVEWFQFRGELNGSGGNQSEPAEKEAPVKDKAGSVVKKNVASVAEKETEPANSQIHDNGNGKTNGNGHLTLGPIKDRWDDLLTEVKPMNHSVSALLRACRPQSFEGETLVLEVSYPFHKERLETAKCRELVETAAGTVFGTPVKIKCVLGENKTVIDSVEEGLVSEAEKIFGAADGTGLTQ